MIGRPKTDLSRAVLTTSHFNRVKRMLHDYSGIFLGDGKEALVKARLLKRLRKLGLDDFDDYFDFIENDATGVEFLSLVDVLTTNKTSFFRESQHFDYINDVVMPSIKDRDVTWWSAGCSSGEEPYTLAMNFLEHKSPGSRGKLRLLATDISSLVLQRAREGVYSGEHVKDIPTAMLRKYFTRIGANPEAWRVDPQIAAMIKFARLNLQEPWPMKGPFNIIMCRNVMIYFNRETQQKLIKRFYDLLEPGGYLFLGHSETISGPSLGFVSVRPAAYQKK
ncbi:MAG: chemotaxis signal relay system methyltransferase CheR [Bacteroidetes bacterium HLUCCA01]|nr:MAG: chemotaxis signal relay system methyltransferase CheR [Bacteroidetes bacterium HLUCCA01]